MNIVQAIIVTGLLAALHLQAAIADHVIELPQESRPPNVVLILVDDMGYGDAACYNPNSKIATPHIDSLARDGMKFTDAHASGPLCHLSRYGLMTGRYPFRGQPEKWSKQPTIEKDRLTLPAMLQNVGYATAMVGKWHLGFSEKGAPEERYKNPLPGGPVDRGFDSFFGIRASTDIPPYFYIRGNRAVLPPTQQIEANDSEGWSRIQGAFWRKGGIASDLELKGVLPRLTNEAVDVIQKHSSLNSKQPLMLYLAYPAPHTPWLPSEDFQGKSAAGMYGDFAMMVDHNIGQVLNALDTCGMADDTLVIFSSDNGPVWYDSDTERLEHDSSGGRRGMKSDAWEGGHRMPFLVRWPGQVQPGSTAKQTISFVDLIATLADIAGANLPKAAAPDSYSFKPVLTDSKHKTPARQDLVLKSGGGHMTIRTGDWKFIDKLGSGGFTKPSKVKPVAGGPDGQLFNLLTDPAETNNVYLKHPVIVKRMRQQMERIIAAEGQRLMQ